MIDDETTVAKGRRALNEMNELQEVFAKLEAAIFREMQQTPIGADVKVQNLHKTLHNLASIQQAMREVVDNGRMAEAAISIAGLTRQN